MKKYKQILAGLLAMNLAVYVMPTGMVQISASEQNQNEEYTDTQNIEDGFQETEEVPESENTQEVETSESAQPDITDGTEQADESEGVSADNTAEIPEQSDSTDIENPEENKEEASSDEELFSDGNQDVSEATASEADVVTQAAEQNSGIGTVHVNQFKNYSDTNKSVTINSAKGLILLSNCPPSELQGLTININGSGEMDLTSKIEKDENISQFYNGTATQAETGSEVAVAEDNSEIQSMDESAEAEAVASQTADSEAEQITSENAENSQNAEEILQEEESSAESGEVSETTSSSGTEENSQGTTSAQSAEVKAEQEYTFQGIGSSACPFQGQITGQNMSLKINRAFFGGLSSRATVSVDNVNFLSLVWAGDGTQPMIADVYQFDSEDQTGHVLPVKVSAGTTAKNEKVPMGALIGTVQAAGDFSEESLNLTENVVDYTNAKEVKVETSEGNAGLICNTLKSGKVCLNGYTLPTSAYTVSSKAEYNSNDNKSAAGNAGGLIGVMEKDTTLSVQSDLSIPAGTEIKSDKGNAGGLVGLMEQGAKIETAADKNIKVNASVIEAGEAAGGVAGMAEDVLFSDEDLKSPVTVDFSKAKDQSITGKNAGGFIGKYTLNADNLGDAANSVKLPDNIVITAPVITTSDDGSLGGGYFGHLDLNGTNGMLTYTISGTDSKKKVISPTYKNCSAEAVGAIAGKVTSSTIASTLQIQNMSTEVTNSNNQGIQYHGGLVGEVGSKGVGSKAVYLNVKDVDIKVGNPYATDAKENGFGGVAGLLAQGSILQTESEIAVDTKSTNINRGGGLVGYAEKSVINLSGKTDLSKVQYAVGAGRTFSGNSDNRDVPKTGWLVGMQESALIYANGDGNGNGWSYIRGKESTDGKQAMNDIGNYGQIIRLKSGESKSNLKSDLIAIDKNHVVTYNPKIPVTLSGDNITIGSEDAFALLSIAWNSRGYFGGINGIATNSTPRLKNIILSANIDLTGSGIAGLSRDTYNKEDSDDDSYSGTFDGEGKTITLAIGETFGYKQDNPTTLATEDDYGYGEVISAGAYYHGRQGLFAKVAGATIKNLTIDGNINISNTEQDMLAGGIAGEIAEAKKTEIYGVTVKQTINAVCDQKGGVMVGGFFGGSYKNGAQLQLDELSNKDTLNTAAATINLKTYGNTTSDTKINAGGVIGEVGESAFTFMANCLDVKGSITTSVKKRAYVGGLIGIIKGNGADQAKNHTIEIKDVTFNGFKIDAKNATEVCGGLFGSIWATAGVYFTGKDYNSNGLKVTNATIDAPNAASVGGLAYRSSGNWEIGDYGIDLQNLTVNAKKDVGLLVCRGEKNNDQVAGKTVPLGALYLSTTKYWDSSYKISQDGVSIKVTDTSGIFDEFVAYTTPSAGGIVDNGKNGVISIATEDGDKGRVGVDENKCTTYQNRTQYGKNHPTNACSRYYYDLDQCLSDIKNVTTRGNKKLDTPQELLIWSVYNYASANIKSCFGIESDITASESDRAYIGGTTKVLDMTKYSYYPIKYEGGSVNITNTTIKFNNEGIENQEKFNKSTQGTTDKNHTQHYGMHCGLFLNYQNIGTLTVRDVEFCGSIGKINENSSGVIVSDFASGYFDKKTSKSSTITINISNIKLNGLKVTECNNDYAPLLINNIGNRDSTNYTYGYTKLNVDTVKIVADSYKNGQAVASSLIGTVGSNKAKEITMSFRNIALPDKEADGTDNGGIFSHATLLEQFAYDKNDTASDATYIFYSTDDWSENGYTHNNVTYGKEITETTEYKDIQKWYYDEATWGTDDGLVYDDKNKQGKFSSKGYLPYVYTAFDSDQCLHEIKVNQRVVDITNGCGTYGHPYRITKEQEMNVLSEYMSTGSPRKDWRVTVTKAQNTAHAAKSNDDYTSDQDVTYQYDGNDWVQVVNKGDGVKDDWQEVTGSIKLGKDFMLNYLLNAYYDIHGTTVKGSDATTGDEDASAAENKLILTDFKGFGTSSKPFRGVITSKNGTTVVLKGAGTANGFIPYSYGSVVKNLKISYEETGKTLTYGKSDNTSVYYPGVNACFGGVIGCVLGGDNIIDDVTVSMDNNWLTLDGEKKHLIQVGGYVGSVTGGGVIFRNMENKSGLSDAKLSNGSNNISVGENAYYSLYVNPYVGRVLDGFAFYESNSKENTLNNTSKNYKINTLVTGDIDCVDITGNTVTVNNAQGLLILSAIINSGAASNGISNAYSRKGRSIGQPVQYPNSDKTTATYFFGGKYGKVRNASYNKIGENDADAILAEIEEQKLPGSENLPYLIQKYCNNNPGIFSLSTNSAMEINLSANEKFDMTGYENGYQGISARYVSNAIQGYEQEDTSAANHPEAIIPKLKSFNGNGRTLTMNIKVREYKDDDFHAASVGGVFNVLRVSADGSISNLIIDKNSSNTNPGISLEYYDKEGQTAEADDKWTSNKEVGVGGLAGSLVGYTSENANRNITIEKIQLNGLKINSPASAGGIVGNTGKPIVDKNNNNDISVLLQPQDSQIAYGVAFNDCSYKDIEMQGKYAAGGFAGYIGNKEQNPRSSVNGDGFTQKTLTRANMGENSTISATDTSSWAGGLFGYVETRMFINMTDEGEKKNTQAVLQGVSVSAGTAVGGCIGYIKEKCYGIHNVIVKGSETKYSTLKILNKSSTQTVSFYAGGIVGYAKGAGQNWTPNWTYSGGISESSVENVQINDEEKSTSHDYSGSNAIQTNYIAGGIVGQVAGGKTRIDGCTVTSDQIYGSVAGGIAGQTDSEMQFINCKTEGTSEQKQTEIKGFSTAGGILGFWTGGQTVTIQDSEVQYDDIEGKDWGVGAFIGDAADGGAGTLYLFDSSAKNSRVNAAGNENGGGGRWPCVGTIIGNLRNTIKASNVLISTIKLTGSDGVKLNNNITKVSKGLLFGNSNSKTVNISGISIQDIPASNKDDNLAGSGNIRKNTDYIAFADYSGSSTNDSKAGKTALIGSSYTKDDKIKTDIAAPYVATSPKSTLKLCKDENDTTGQYLYGDGASWETKPGSNSSSIPFTVKAQEIYTNRSSENKDHYQYAYITDPSNKNAVSNNFDFASVISTYNTNQETKAGEDFPVVQIAAGKVDVVKDYLNILTNGGFSNANEANSSDEQHVTATTEVYSYKDGKFVKDSEAAPSFKVNTDTNRKITFSTTTNYDNGENRFTLLTVTFTEKDADNKEHHYNVLVPILVRRMLEIDFSATLTYGTDFKKEDYKSRTAHVLESFGNSVTGYLTYTYNSAEGTYTDYGWQSYVDAGGDMLDMKKNIKFVTTSATFPKGTQLTLVDADSGKAYYYTATGSEEYKERAFFDIPLAEFADSEGDKYQEPSISELVKASATKASDGLFVKVGADGKPENSDETKEYPPATVRIKNSKGEYEYYRLAANGEKGEYKIDVNEEGLGTNGKSSVTENYYLVITVPKDSDGQETRTSALNGSIQTTVTSKIPHLVHYRKISGEVGKDGEDNHDSTASTYQLSNGYQQVLKETGNDGQVKQITLMDSKLKIDITDTITFPFNQAYQPVDEIYLRFVGGLQSGGTSTANSSAEQFPSGTTGEVNFYVYTENSGTKTYYVYDTSSKAWEQGNDERIATSYVWTSTGGNMELPLSTDGSVENAISLQGLRSSLINMKINEFHVEAKLDATIPGSGIDVIPESELENGSPKDYVKLTYASQLSTEKKSLNYSSNRASFTNTTTQYYRAEPAGAKLSYDADKIDQLGINLLDLQSVYLDKGRNDTFINTTASYDLSSMKNLKNTLENSNGIKFTLSLKQKKSETDSPDAEAYGTAISNAPDYLGVELQSKLGQGTEPAVSYNGGSWSWTVPKSAYYDTGAKKITTSSVFNGSILTQAILLKVNVKNVEAEQHFYSNYMVELTAEILDKDGNSVQNTRLTDNIVYTLARIKPEFVD